MLGIRDKDKVEVRSRRGRAVLPAVVTDRVRPGNCFAPFHWNDVFGEDLAINAVTSDAIDPISQQPEFKFCAVALLRIAEEPLSIPPISENNEVLAPMLEGASAGTSAIAIKELDMKHIDALAALLGLDAAPAVALNAHEQLYLQGYLTALRTDASRQAGGVPVLPVTAPLETAKRLMLDGMLAGLFARTWLPSNGADSLSIFSPAAPAVTTAPVRPSITVLWTSSTGNAEGFAAQCAKRLKAEGHAVTLAGMDGFKVADLVTAPRVLLLASTFGDGDPPDNGSAFWTALQADAAPKLDTTEFSILAFGDSNYNQFCGFGRKLDARLEALGARRLLTRTDCESDYQEAALAWLDGVVKVLADAAAPVAAKTVNIRAPALAGDIEEEAAVPPASQSPTFSRSSPLRTHLVLNRLLNAPGAEKETRQFAFDLAGHGFSYETGDALGVWPTNCPELVGDMLAALKLSPSSAVTVKDHGDMTLTDALLHHFEVARITPEVLQFVRERSGSETLVRLSKNEHKDELKQWLWGQQLIDLLQTFPIQVQASEWLAVLKRVQPRLYSISSSPKAERDQVHLTVSTVRYACDGKKRGGVCSTFLADRARHGMVSIFVQKSAHFRPPKNPDAPMIMVGPGTGIAPFRAFLQERQATGAKGKNWLFFGEQRAATDFYYREELESMQRDGNLHRLDTAFSRDQIEKIYVQHRIIEHGAQLWACLQEGGHFYVCGDASRMAKDVDAALKQVAQTHGAMSADDAAAYVTKMAQDKRYLRDVY